MTFEAIPDLLADILQEQKNTNEVLTRLLEAFAGLRAPAAAAKAETKKAIAKAAEAIPDTAAAEVTATAPASPPAAPDPLEYKKDLGPTFAKLLTDKGPMVVVEVLSRFGVKKGCELPVEQLQPALAAAQAALAL